MIVWNTKGFSSNIYFRQIISATFAIHDHLSESLTSSHKHAYWANLIHLTMHVLRKICRPVFKEKKDSNRLKLFTILFQEEFKNLTLVYILCVSVYNTVYTNKIVSIACTAVCQDASQDETTKPSPWLLPRYPWLMASCLDNRNRNFKFP